jgi:hypothetical protein
MPKFEEEIVKQKLCIFCENFYLDLGSRGYSEYTPGWSGETGCIEGHWKITDDSLYAVKTYREGILKAKNCEDWIFFNEKNQ